MITLTHDEAEIIHTFLRELCGAWDWKLQEAGERNLTQYRELADCIGWMEAKIEGSGKTDPRPPVWDVRLT